MKRLLEHYSKEQLLAVAAFAACVLLLLTQTRGLSGDSGEVRIGNVTARNVLFPRPFEAQFVNPDVSKYDGTGREIFAAPRATRLALPQLRLPEPPLEPPALLPFRPTPRYRELVQKLKWDFLYVDPKRPPIPGAEVEEARTDRLRDLKEPVISRPADQRAEKVKGREYDEVWQKNGPVIKGTLVAVTGTTVVIKDITDRQHTLPATSVEKIIRSLTWEEWYKEESGRLKNDWAGRFNLAKEIYGRGMIPEAKRELEVIARNDPGRIEAVELLVKLCLQDYEFDKAVEVCDAVLRRVDSAEKQARVHYLLGLLWREFGLTDRAIEEFHLGYPGVVDAGFEKGRLLIQAGRLEEAAEFLSNMLRAHGPAGRTAAECLVLRARARWQMGFKDEAKKDLEEAAKLNATLSAEALNVRGAIKAYEKDYRGAVDDLVAALEQNQYLTDAWINLALLFLGAAKASRAEELLQAALDRDPTSGDVYSLLGICEIVKENLVGAKSYFERSLATERDNFYGMYCTAWVHMRDGDYAGAVDLFGKVIRREFYFVPLYYNAAVGYMKTGQVAQAEALLREVAEMRDRDVAPRIALIILYLNQGKQKKAEEEFARAAARREVAGDPVLSYLNGYLVIGRSYGTIEKRLEEARTHFINAAQLGSEEGRAAATEVAEWLATYVRFDEKFNREAGPKVGGGWSEVESELFRIEIADRRCRFFSTAEKQDSPPPGIAYTAIFQQITGEPFYSLEATFYPKETARLREFGAALLYSPTPQAPFTGSAFVLRFDRNESKLVGCICPATNEKMLAEDHPLTLEKLATALNQQEIRVKFLRRQQEQFNYLDIYVWDDGTSQWKLVKQQLPFQGGKDSRVLVMLFARSPQDAAYEFFVDDVRVLERRTD